MNKMFPLRLDRLKTQIFELSTIYTIVFIYSQIALKSGTFFPANRRTWNKVLIYLQCAKHIQMNSKRFSVSKKKYEPR